jgi:hypothetical protein
MAYDTQNKPNTKLELESTHTHAHLAWFSERQSTLCYRKR